MRALCQKNIMETRLEDLEEKKESAKRRRSELVEKANKVADEKKDDGEGYYEEATEREEKEEDEAVKPEAEGRATTGRNVGPYDAGLMINLRS